MLQRNKNLDIFAAQHYVPGMKKLLLIASLLLCSSPALAEDATMTIIQQYLYNESGYAPQSAPASPTPQQIAADAPYGTAYATSSGSRQASVDDESYMESVHLNEGVRGMNLY
jgi:hypothetical protein